MRQQESICECAASFSLNLNTHLIDYTEEWKYQALVQSCSSAGDPSHAVTLAILDSDRGENMP